MNKNPIITILLAFVAMLGHPQGYHVRSEKIAPLSLSSLRLSPSAPDFRALPRAFLCRFPVTSERNILNYLGISKNLTTFAV